MKMNQVFQIRCDNETRRAIDDLAKKTNLSRSQAVRLLIETGGHTLNEAVKPAQVKAETHDQHD